ncbi:DEAD/DEAH box helicase [Streptomyces sp. 5-6(2022)]|uniref:DEAD/DEAH box helicase n=1 Tax=Streptomyces sp. 5-6(2022) TaxID=2936510 RepID=UPI0023B96031|nr:DEAD/DEAH box helicase [Streptomyces sp. 5-6(2022)]
MERTVDPQILAQALGIHDNSILPTLEELATLIAEAEVAAIRGRVDIGDQMLATAWFLHGIAAARVGPQYGPVRRRHAFAVSAHLLELGLSDPRHQTNDTPDAEDGTAGPAEPGLVVRARRLAMAFGAQIGYRRCEQDPNATAVFRQVDDLLVTETDLADHLDTLAVEAGVAFLGMQRRRASRVLRRWRTQLQGIAALTSAESLHGTLFGPAEAVVDACSGLLVYLARADTVALERARGRLRSVVTGEAGRSDRSARWVAAHLLELVEDLQAGSLQSLLPDGSPPALARAFALSDPPVMTLWPPQRDLLTTLNPLDPTTRRLLISVPTSAGKTLMAQLIICGHLAAHPDERVLYLSPLRSLGREMRQSLRARLRLLGRTLAAEEPDFSAPGVFLGPTAGDVDIMTPERLMHALRQDPTEALEDVGLIVVDEAHHIQQGRRGFLLEGLLAFCQSHPAPPRLVLLSAAVGNHGHLAAWLDDTQPPEKVAFTQQWRGPRRLHGVLAPHAFEDRATRIVLPPRANRTRNTERRVPMGLRISVRPTADGTLHHMTTDAGEPLGERIYREKTPGDISGKLPASVTNRALFAYGAAHLADAGSVLVVCGTRNDAKAMAEDVARHLDPHPPAAPLAGFLAQTLGEDHPLVACARHGVAYHHARLPTEVLHPVEEALRSGQLQVICCTSTLTDGVNLPVRSVVIHTDVDDGFTTPRPGKHPMSPAQLLNAIGRAGRAGRESEGWVLLARNNNPKAADFRLLAPKADSLTVLSALGTTEALASLAQAEDLIARSADAILTVAASQAADFISYVWFILASYENIPTLTHHHPLDALDRLLAMRQLKPELAARWKQLSHHVTNQYLATDTEARRRWTTPGTSIATARNLDIFAAVLARRLLEEDSPPAAGPSSPQDTPDPWAPETDPWDDIVDDDAWGPVFGTDQADEWPLEYALDALASHGVFPFLLTQPEGKDAWRFTQKPGSRSEPVTVDVNQAVRDWIDGHSIPSLAADWLPGLEPEWALEQTVSNISVTFEHYLAWTLGALINLVNARLEETGAGFRLPTALGWHIRHGVDTPHALHLLNRGITSRRLAHRIGQASGFYRLKDLRDHLRDLHIERWRDDFGASPYEIGELLEYVRHRRSLINDLLDHGSCTLRVTLTGPSRWADEVRITGADTSRPVPLMVTDNGENAARIPAEAHNDVLTILESGIDFTLTLTHDDLTFHLTRQT